MSLRRAVKKTGLKQKYANEDLLEDLRISLETQLFTLQDSKQRLEDETIDDIYSIALMITDVEKMLKKVNKALEVKT